MNTTNITFSWVREFAPTGADDVPANPAEIRSAKKTLKQKGWSYRRAAPVLGVHHVHLALVMGGHRQSRRLLAAIANLPSAPTKKGAK